MLRRRFLLQLPFLAPIVVLAWSSAGRAQPAPPRIVSPDIPVLAVRRGGQLLRSLSVAELEQMPKASFKTGTPWQDAPTVYEGVPLKALFEALGATGEKVVVGALNGFMAPIPLSEATKYEVILAYRRDGAYMPVRDKGPLFIVYNYDAQKASITEQQYARSVWQVSSITLD
jgi:hypothetical protein